jgi:uncharacterized membrane protein HdeD (DUF308 family)
MNSFSEALASGVNQVRRSWSWFLALGIILMTLGLACIAKAATATKFSILALGWVLAISAVVWAVSALFAFSWHGFFLYTLNAVIRGVTGFLLIRHPDAGAESVTLVIAVLFMSGGLFRGIAASVLQFPRWGWTVLSGFVSFGLGVYVLANWSAVSAYLVGLVIGVDLLMDGASLAGFAGAISSLPKAPAVSRTAA